MSPTPSEQEARRVLGAYGAGSSTAKGKCLRKKRSTQGWAVRCDYEMKNRSKGKGNVSRERGNERGPEVFGGRRKGVMRKENRERNTPKKGEVD